MHWQESHRESEPVPDNVVDLSYQIDCRRLPVDHAWALSQAVIRVLPWLEAEPSAGVHPIHVAESGNGWMRPENASDLLVLSRRTRLVLRLPRARLDDAQALVGQRLDVDGHVLRVEQASVRTLNPHGSIFARYVACTEGQDENAFLQAILQEMAGIGVRPKKMLCGIEKQITTPEQKLQTRSLMVAALTRHESILLQEQGVGPRRSLGCGLFIPHKDIHDLRQPLE